MAKCEKDSGPRSADLQSAVSQIFNLLNAGNVRTLRQTLPAAECNSAIQQITNLRYFLCGSREALLHCQPSGVAQSRAFTGLLTTYSQQRACSTSLRIQWSNDSGCQKASPVRLRILLASRAVYRFQV